jgi:hypothetical protein
VTAFSIHSGILTMICPAGKTAGLYASEAEAYCLGLKVYAAVVLYAKMKDRSASRRPLVRRAESSSLIADKVWKMVA